ncbi:elongation factor EF-2 [Candidatus Woesearchaeota archaeon]|nr:elongation factor EF-2 [Candidatus Woesearchaeota archaeon]
MAEKMADMVARITKNPKFIRNICTSAHIHHGKCISGASKIILGDGTISTAGNLFDLAAQEGTIVQDTDEHSVYQTQRPITIFSLNTATKKIEKKVIQHFWRLCGGKTQEITLRNGFSISTTPEHKYIVWNSGFHEVEAKDLKIGDRIVTPRRLSTSSISDIRGEILGALSKGNFYARLKAEFFPGMKEKILSFGFKNLAFSIKKKSFYHGLWQNRFFLADLLACAGALGISSADVYDQIGFIFYRNGKQRGHNSIPIKLPQNFEEFFYLAGLFTGDGSREKFVVGKPLLGGIVKTICKSLGFFPREVHTKERTPEIHTHLTLAHMFNALFGYPLAGKAHGITISEFLARSDKKFGAAFLRGYFDTDGSVEWSRRAVTISSASKKMIDTLHLYLLQFNIIAIKEIDNTLSISGISAYHFQKQIGFGLSEKREKLALLVKKVTGNRVCDSISVNDQLMLVEKKVEMLAQEDLAAIEVSKIEAGFEDVVYDFTIPDNHNFVAEGMVIHNTAMTDNLLAAAGHMASKYAGDLEGGMATWQHKDEQERLMTVDAANVSMVHEFHGNEYLINLIDTPGHVDFGGNVTRAMRAIDGTIVLICAVEGVMPQTETVVKQALRERVKPVLFINKVDRLVKELKLSPEKIQERFVKLISGFNNLIEDIAEPQFKEKWKVSIMDGSVAFGSARENWALSYAFMQKKKIGFKDILNIYEMDEAKRKEWVWANAPLHEVILDMVIKHHPDPLTAQPYRIPKIWHGETESELGKSLVSCDPNGKPAFVITRIVIDPRSGKDIAAGRLFSGTLRPGIDVYLNNARQHQKIQNLYIYNGIKPELIESIPAGNVCAISGVIGNAGETVTLDEEHPFEELKHIFEPVITKAIKPKISNELPKLIEVLRKVGREDPSIVIEINEETGENLLSGMGELHLEIIENRIITEKGVEVLTSQPVVVFRESITKKSQEVEGKTPNKHNKFYFTVEPLSPEVQKAIKEGMVPEGRIKKKNTDIRDALVAAGMESKEAEKVKDIYKGNMFLDLTRGQVYAMEVMEMILDMFEEVMRKGPLAREPSFNIRVSLNDMSLHEDAIHRGPAQVYPAIREGIRGAMLNGGPIMFEPMQIMLIEAPNDYTGKLTALVSSIRGQLIDLIQEGNYVNIKAKLPVMNMLSWSSDLRSATEGRGVSSLIDQSFERLPFELQVKVINDIKKRKGLTDAMVGV